MIDLACSEYRVPTSSRLGTQPRYADLNFSTNADFTKPLSNSLRSFQGKATPLCERGDANSVGVQLGHSTSRLHADRLSHGTICMVKTYLHFKPTSLEISFSPWMEYRIPRQARHSREYPIRGTKYAITGFEPSAWLGEPLTRDICQEVPGYTTSQLARNGRPVTA